MELLINGYNIDLFNREELWSIFEDLHENSFIDYEFYISVKFYLLEKLIEMGDKAAEKTFKDGVLKNLSEGLTSITYDFYQKGFNSSCNLILLVILPLEFRPNQPRHQLNI